MTTFSFNPVTPHPLLAPYVAKMWVFKSSGRLPELDRKLIVPNANFKLAFTSQNGLVAQVENKTFTQKEQELSFTGLIDSAVMLNPHEDIQTDTIVVELNPLGAYRLFYLPYGAIKNQITGMTDLLGNPVKELQSRLADTEIVAEKLQLLQHFLIKQLEKAAPDLIYDHCVKRIYEGKGLITVAQLEKETGYSARWLHKKFTEHLGTGPKNLAEIIRFKQFYQAYSAGASLHHLKEYIYEYYYDQSHFLRAFKRFTGSTPTDLQNSLNDLATKHYTS
ncbi:MULTISPECIES: helix-turn-helix domain-containing protein [Niastella]|uniref:Helix-turn-helix transcriptional regulator n=1 Tax=Niastella soli TaxID=2821487 RepID=A0ABS3Z2B6_9BACT|nr:AraC family transcriptional regulator [Niastella soli]MBO9204303.1 helix-turn-helix transcriptional regulator [Niastella soli]